MAFSRVFRFTLYIGWSCWPIFPSLPLLLLSSTESLLPRSPPHLKPALISNLLPSVSPSLLLFISCLSSFAKGHFYIQPLNRSIYPNTPNHNASPQAPLQLQGVQGSRPAHRRRLQLLYRPLLLQAPHARSPLLHRPGGLQERITRSKCRQAEQRTHRRCQGRMRPGTTIRNEK